MLHINNSLVVARDVLYTYILITDSIIQSSFVKISSKHCLSQTVGASNLKFWENVHHTFCVTCPVSHVTCHKSYVTCHMSQVPCKNIYLCVYGQESPGWISLYKLGTFFVYLKIYRKSNFFGKNIGQWIRDRNGRGIDRDIKKNYFHVQNLTKNGNKVWTI